MSPYERLLTVTLALEQALNEESWDEVTSLLDERDQIIGGLTNGGSSARDRDLAEKAKSAEERCRTLIQVRKSQVTQGLMEAISGRRARSAYGATQVGAAFHVDL